MKIILILITTLISIVPNTKITNEKKTINNTKTIEITKVEFLEKIVDYETNPNEWKYLGDKPAIVDFYNPSCDNCKILALILEKIALKYKGEIYIYKVNTKKEQSLATAFGIKITPTILFSPISGIPQMIEGIMLEKDLKKIISKNLLK